MPVLPLLRIHDFVEEADTLDFLETVLRLDEERTVFVECPVEALMRRLKDLLQFRLKDTCTLTKKAARNAGSIMSNMKTVVFLSSWKREFYNMDFVTDEVRYIPEFWKRETEKQ